MSLYKLTRNLLVFESAHRRCYLSNYCGIGTVLVLGSVFISASSANSGSELLEEDNSRRGTFFATDQHVCLSFIA